MPTTFWIVGVNKSDNAYKFSSQILASEKHSSNVGYCNHQFRCLSLSSVLIWDLVYASLKDR